MRVVGRDLQDLVSEQRLLRDVLRLVRRCDGAAPVPVLDAVLAGTSAVRPLLPRQRNRRRP